MGLSNTKLCSFCKSNDETTLHLFHDCIKVKALWVKLSNFFRPILILPSLTPESAFLGFENINDILINHILLIFKIAIYNSRNKGTCSFEFIINKIKHIKRLEDNLTFLNENQRHRNETKWAKISNKLT